MMLQHCLRSWEDSKMLSGHGPTPVMEGQTEDNRTNTCMQETTKPQASDRQTPKPNIEGKQRPRIHTIKLEVTADESDTTEGDETNRLGISLGVISNGPTEVEPERTTPTPTLPTFSEVKPGPHHPHDSNTSLQQAGTAAHQHGPQPQQSRDVGRGITRRSTTFANPGRVPPETPTPEDTQGTSLICNSPSLPIQSELRPLQHRGLSGTTPQE